MMMMMMMKTDDDDDDEDDDDDDDDDKIAVTSARVTHAAAHTHSNITADPKQAVLHLSPSNWSKGIARCFICASNFVLIDSQI